MRLRSKLCWAAAPLVLVFDAAAVEINDAQTAPVSTSTVDGGAPDDIDITADGSITLDNQDGATAVTVDSDNSVTNAGQIVVNDSNNSVGVRLTPGFTGGLDSSGSILIQEDFTRPDDDADGDLDGPIAQGENNVGVLLEAGGAFTGDIRLRTGGTLLVEGNNSAGVRLESTLNGLLETRNATTIIGDDSVAIDIQGGVNGDVRLGGAQVVNGENSVGVSVTGAISGAFENEAAIIVTGFESQTATNFANPDLLDAEALANGGPAVAIGADLTNGFLNNGSVDRFISQEDIDDETRDTLDDFDDNRTTGSIASIGGSPAVLITPDWGGAATADLVLGPVVETITDDLDDDGDGDLDETIATFNLDQGFINRGLITADGQNSGFVAEAVVFRGAEAGGFQTIVQGGILNTGTVQATGFNADSAAFRIGSGTIIGSLENDGTIAASSVSNDTPGNATGVFLEAGSEVTSLVNSGNIDVETQSFDAFAIGVLDQSNQLASILNTGSIDSSFRLDTPGDEAAATGGEFAIDVSASTIDVTLVQQEGTPVDDVNGDGDIDGDDIGDPSITGDIRFGAGSDTFDLLFGTVTGDTDFGAGDNTFNFSAGTYNGNVAFGAGADTFSLNGATLAGDVTFAGGINTLSLANGASLTGAITTTNGGLINLAVDNSVFNTTSATGFDAGTAVFSNNAILQIAIDPSDATAGAKFVANDSVTFSGGSQIDLVFDTLTTDPFTTVLIEAPVFNIDGDLDSLLTGDLPVIFATELSLVDNGTQSLVAEFRVLDANELPLNPNQAAAYNAFLSAFVGTSDLGPALASLTTTQELQDTLQSVLPQSSNTSLRFLAAQATAGFGAVADRLDAIRFDSSNRGRGFWIQQYANYINGESTAEAPGFDGEGFGIAFGVDTSTPIFDTVGAAFLFSTGTFEESLAVDSPLSTTSVGLGLYASESISFLDIDLAGSASRVNFDGDRRVALDGVEEVFTSDYSGWTYSGTARLSSTFQAGGFFVRPAIGGEYTRLDQDAYVEETPLASDLVLNVGAGESDLLSATGTLTIGTEYGREGGVTWVPEFTGGYRANLSATPFEAQVNFINAADTFQITTEDSYDDAIIAGVSIAARSRFFSFKLGVDAEASDDTFAAFGGASLRWRFF